MNNDLHNQMAVRPVISPIAIGPLATKTGKIIDRRGFGGLEFIAEFGDVVTTGTVVTLVAFEGNVTGTMTSVADGDLLGTEALASLLATTPRVSGVSKKVAKRLGYKGSARYVRVDAIGTGASSVAPLSVSAVLFNPMVSPTPNP